MEGKVVKLRIYDLSHGMMKQMSSMWGHSIEGIWHTAVEVFQKEYYFGRGIICVVPGNTPYGVPVETVVLGTTMLDEDVFNEYIESVRSRYNAETYNLMLNNCNHFSNEMTMFLCSKEIPQHILNLPEIVMSSPMYKNIMMAFIPNKDNDRDKKP